MANRFRDTKIWDEDWYCNLGGEYQQLWNYLCDTCDNAGVWKPNKIGFERSTGYKVNLDSFLKKVNGDKQRIRTLDNGRWFLPGFIKYQWFTKHHCFDLVLSNNLHLSLYKILMMNGIDIVWVRGLQEVLQGSTQPYRVKVKDKEIVQQDKAIKNSVTANNPQLQPLGMDIVKQMATKAWQDEDWKQSINYGQGMDMPQLKRWMALFNASLCNDPMPNFNEERYKKLFGGWLSMQKTKGRKLANIEVDVSERPLEHLQV